MALFLTTAITPATGPNYAKIGGLIVFVLGLIVFALPIPLQYIAYINGASIIINGALHFWYGTPNGSAPIPVKRKPDDGLTGRPQ